MMKMFGLTDRYFPFPQPTSSPMEPSGREVRNLETMGHGCHVIGLAGCLGRLSPAYIRGFGRSNPELGRWRTL